MPFVFLDPRQGLKSGLVDPAPRLLSLSGQRIGIIWNNRPGGDEVLKRVADILNRKHGFSEVHFTKKTYIGNGAPPEHIEDLASRIDAAIVGVGD